MVDEGLFKVSHALVSLYAKMICDMEMRMADVVKIGEFVFGVAVSVYI